MVSIKNPFKKNESITEAVSQTVKKSELNPEVKRILIGRNTVFSLLSFIVGGVLIGSTLFNVSTELLGELFTFVLGLVLFIAGGVLSKAFRK